MNRPIRLTTNLAVASGPYGAEEIARVSLTLQHVSDAEQPSQAAIEGLLDGQMDQVRRMLSHQIQMWIDSKAAMA